jgi:hypothetical protein
MFILLLFVAFFKYIYSFIVSIKSGGQWIKSERRRIRRKKDITIYKRREEKNINR